MEERLAAKKEATNKAAIQAVTMAKVVNNSLGALEDKVGEYEAVLRNASRA